jgi:glycosyl transferase family 87
MSAAKFRLPRPVDLTCFAFCVANVVSLAAMLVQGEWLVDAQGQVIATDFANVWAAGRQVLDGHALAAYDVALHNEAEVAVFGHPFAGEYAWFYPPTFLFPAALLALLPFALAHAAWPLLTFSAYAVTLRGIIGDRVGLFFACAFPGVIANFVVGQNGLATAALLGGGLLFLQRRPVLAGCLFGLLTFKPHLGIWIPLVLIAGGYWRVIAAAAVTAALLAAAAGLAFGPESWIAFFHALPDISQSVFIDGDGGDFFKLQSLFGFVRVLGGSNNLALTLQAMLAAATGLLLFVTWRSRLSFDLKAAALVAGTLLTSPYLFLYDLAVLAVAMAFLLRAARDEGPASIEWFGLLAASLLILAFPLRVNLVILVLPLVKAPVGFVANLIVVLLIARRALPPLVRQVSAPAIS